MTIEARAAPAEHPMHHAEEVPVWGRRGTQPLGAVRHGMQRLVTHGELVVGRWEYDPDAAEVVVAPFSGAVLGDPGALAEAKLRVERLLQEVGHARAFRLDRDDAVRERASALRAVN